MPAHDRPMSEHRRPSSRRRPSLRRPSLRLTSSRPTSMLAVGLAALLLASCSAGPGDDLAAGWSTIEVEDADGAGFVLPLPPQGTSWTPGDDDGYAALAATAAETDWWRFWAPRLEALTPATSNVRAMAAGGDTGALYAIQVNRSGYDLDADPGDAAAIAEAFGSIAIAQGSELTEARTITVDGFAVDEVAEVAFTVDPDVLARDVWQRIVPVPARDELWSVQCDAPSGTDAEASCRAALNAFAFTP
jgi:hypothetical protein